MRKILNFRFLFFIGSTERERKRDTLHAYENCSETFTRGQGLIKTDVGFVECTYATQYFLYTYMYQYPIL